MNKKMKIVFFAHYSQLYGANQSLLALLEEIKEEANEILVVINDTGNRDDFSCKLDQLGMPYVYIKNKYLLYYHSLIKYLLKMPFILWFNIYNIIILYKLLRKNKPDIIYSNSSVDTLGIILAKMLNVKHIWHVREFGEKDYNLKHIWGDSFKRIILNRSDNIIAISQSIFDYINIPSKTELIFNGIIKNSPTRRVRSLGSQIKLSIVGRVSKQKGQLHAINSFYKISNRFNAILYLYGEGNDDYMIFLKKYVDSLGLSDRVVFMGFVNDKSEIYDNTDVLIMSSLNEAFGRVTIEAMSYGIPVVGYKNAGTSEIIKNKINGLLYDSFDVSLEDCLTQLFEDSVFYSFISNRAYEESVKYNTKIYGEKVLNVILNNSCC